jgi:NADPH-dependent 2,4-dienoyl-CoA reductase/sulfur reductase-like enzyme
MKKEFADIVIVGGGPAGLAAALEAKRAGADRVVVLERALELGGILRQCIHDGFGVHRFKKRMSGNEYAQVFIDEIERSGVSVYTDTTVIDIVADNGRGVNGNSVLKNEKVCAESDCRLKNLAENAVYYDMPKNKKACDENDCDGMPKDKKACAESDCRLKNNAEKAGCVSKNAAEKIVYAVSGREGMLEITADAIILATGCRERTASQVFIHGERPAGVLTAGVIQRYINIEGYLPGRKAVILGSGDIGLIMARRMTLEGIEVEGVYEVMPSPGGLTRNIVQCLDDYGIPLHLSTTVVGVEGRDRINAVIVAKVDEKRVPVEGTERRIECDLLALAVGLIPENELAAKIGVEIDPRTKGAVLNDRFETNVSGVFAAGNAATVFDLVDYVSISGEIAARGAMEYLKEKRGSQGERGAARLENSEFIRDEKAELRAFERVIAARESAENTECFRVVAGENIAFVIPQRVRRGTVPTFFMRVKTTADRATLFCGSGGKVLTEKAFRHIAPPEMLSFEASGEVDGDLVIDVIDKI